MYCCFSDGRRNRLTPKTFKIYCISYNDFITRPLNSLFL